MKAADIMATEVVTVTPESTVQEVAEILLRTGSAGRRWSTLAAMLSAS